MHSNQFDSLILGTISNGQGFVSTVEGTHRAALRVLVAKFARRLSLHLGSWRALSIKRMAAWRAMPGRAPSGSAAVFAVTCPRYSVTRRQRDQRSMPGVVVDTGTVGVC